MIYLLLLITIVCNAIMDSIMSNDTFAKWGIWFSRDGWQTKYVLTEWLNKFIPLWLAKFIAQDVLVIFTELYKFAKFIMILSFMFAIFGFTWKAILAYLIWGLLFSAVYTLIR